MNDRPRNRVFRSARKTILSAIPRQTRAEKCAPSPFCMEKLKARSRPFIYLRNCVIYSAAYTVNSPSSFSTCNINARMYRFIYNFSCNRSPLGIRVHYPTNGSGGFNNSALIAARNHASPMGRCCARGPPTWATNRCAKKGGKKKSLFFLWRTPRARK